MPRLNFEQPSRPERDIGGPSGATLMFIAIIVCTFWALQPMLMNAFGQ